MPAIVTVTVVALVAVTVVLLNDRPSSRSVTASERQLRAGYLEPLTEAGLAIEVLDACHYYRYSPDKSGAPGPEDGWHFSVKIAVSESPDTVAQSLRQKTGAVIVDDRTPILVQQYRGQPNRGWNGTIADAEGGSIVTVVKNNIATSDRSIPIGWQSICAETRPT
jgi:hypothetical protein